MKFITVFLLLIAIVFSEGTTVKLTKFEACKNRPDAKGRFKATIITRDGTQYVKNVLTITEEVSSWNKLIIYATKCSNRDNLNYCENYRNFTIPRIGSFIGVDTPWGKKLQYTPPLKFPLKPGAYAMEEVKVDTSWTVIAAKGYWRNYACCITNEGDLAFCVYAEGEIF